jgi:hypothetical protein
MSNAAEENKITELPESEPAHRIAWPRRSVVDDLDSGDNPVLQVDVVDVPFDGQPPMRVLQWKNTTDLKRVLEEIRPQPAGTARVFGYASYSDRKRSKAEGEEKGRHTLENHLSSTYGLPYYGPPGRTRAEPGSDIRDIALQWTQSRSDCDMMRTDIAKLSLKTYLVSRHERFKVTSAESSTLRCWKDGDDKLIGMLLCAIHDVVFSLIRLYSICHF